MHGATGPSHRQGTDGSEAQQPVQAAFPRADAGACRAVDTRRLPARDRHASGRDRGGRTPALSLPLSRPGCAPGGCGHTVALAPPPCGDRAGPAAACAQARVASQDSRCDRTLPQPRHRISLPGSGRRLEG